MGSCYYFKDHKCSLHKTLDYRLCHSNSLKSIQNLELWWCYKTEEDVMIEQLERKGW